MFAIRRCCGAGNHVRSRLSSGHAPVESAQQPILAAAQTTALNRDDYEPEAVCGVRPLADAGGSVERRVTHRRRGRSQRGLTLVELIVAFTIMSLLTAMSVPLARYKVRRDKERQLRHALREIHVAIDKYKDAADMKLIASQKIDADGYPESLEVLVEGVKLQGQVEKKIRFLRRIPRDPFTNSTDWGKRSTQDDQKSNSWGGQNVFQVYSKTMEKAADGTPYSEW